MKLRKNGNFCKVFCNSLVTVVCLMSVYVYGGYPYTPYWYNIILIDEGPVCYTLVTANRRLAPRYVERSVSVYGLDECKILCTRETTFDCRSFSFRRRSSSLNCDLSREDSASLDLSSPYVLANDPDFDYYQKTSRGSTCYQQYNSKPVYGSQGSGYSNSYPSLYPVVSGASSPGFYQGQSFPSSDPGCYRRLKSGYRLDSRVVRLSVVARSQSDCELECNRSRGFACRSFSFKFPTYLSSGYGSPYTNSRDFNNCDLSDLEPRNIDPVRHLILDRDADIYERIQDWRDCREKTDGSSLLSSSSALLNKPPLTSQCFQRLFRGGLRMERRIIRFTVSVKSPRECEQECLNAKFFTCRGFSYRYSQSAVIPDAYHKDYDNCDLTDIDLNLVDPTRDFIDDGNYDTWRKAGTGRECDFLSNILPDTTGSGSGLNQGSVDPWSRPSQLDQFAGQDQLVGCYARYRGGYRLDPRIVRDSTNVRTLAECEVECSKARFNCLMFSFRFSNRNGDYGQNPNNCELSNLSTLELDRYRDMIEDRDYETFSRAQNNRNCNFRISDKAYPVDSLTSSSSGGFGLNSVGLSSSDITVSGLHCRAGTWCRPNQNSDYWFCETDSNGNWDYCCKPTHPCGYTEGFSYPWCFVGTDEDANRLHGSKWRPCSERYAERPYAYLHRESPPNNTSLPEILQTIHRFASNSSSLSRSSVSVSPNTEESESVTASPGANERQPPTL